MNNARKRTLAFERLETKSAPAALLVALAPLDDNFHDRAEASAQAAALESTFIDTSTNWQFQHSVGTLLRFVEENTMTSAREVSAWPTPTQAQCDNADEMMKLQNGDLRSDVITDSLHS